MRNCKCLHDKAAAAAGITQGAAAIFSIASDFVGKQQDLAFSAPECGKRPFFIGKKRNEWETCAAKYRQTQNQFKGMTNTPPATGAMSFISKYKTPLIIGGGLLAAYFIFKPKLK
jgi:hypothetical protein